MTDDKFEFVCVICGSEFASETAAQECRVCHKTECNECISEAGACVPCSALGGSRFP